MGERKEDEQSQCLPKGGPLVLAGGGGSAGSQGGMAGTGGCSAGRLAPRKAAGSEWALWQTTLVPGLPFISWEKQLG